MRALLPLYIAATAAFTALAQARNAPRLQSTPLATVTGSLQPVADSRTMAVFAASESARGVDSNGDLDAVHWVVQVHDLRSGNTRSFGIAVHPNIPPVMDDALLVMSAAEQGRGSTDLDGGGTVTVWFFVVDLAAVGPRPVGVEIASIPAFAISGNRVYWRALANRHTGVSDRSTNVWADLGWRSNSGLFTRGGVVAFSVPESENGPQELNGDGDTEDRVAFVLRMNP